MSGQVASGMRCGINGTAADGMAQIQFKGGA